MAATGPAPAPAAISGRRSRGPTSRSTSRARTGEPPLRPSWARRAASRPRRPIQNPLPASPRRCPHPSTHATALSNSQIPPPGPAPPTPTPPGPRPPEPTAPGPNTPAFWASRPVEGLRWPSASGTLTGTAPKATEPVPATRTTPPSGSGRAPAWAATTSPQRVTRAVPSRSWSREATAGAMSRVPSSPASPADTVSTCPTSWRAAAAATTADVTVAASVSAIPSATPGPRTAGRPGPSTIGHGRPSPPITAARQRLRPPSTATRLPIDLRYSAVRRPAGATPAVLLRSLSEGRHPDDRSVDLEGTGGAEERGVAEGEDPAVGRHQPV